MRDLLIEKWFDWDLTSGSSPNVTKALTALTATFSEGVLGANVANALSAQTSTFTEGTISAQISYALTAKTATFTEGTLSPAVAYALVGQTATFTEGILTPSTGGDVTIALAGLTATFTEGAMVPNIAYPVNGQSATFTQGTLSASASYGIAGQAATFTEGLLTPSWSGSAALTGQTATFSQGTPIPQVTMAISGQSANFTEGALGNQIDFALTALTGIFTEGVITPAQSGDVTKALTALTAAFTNGLMTPSPGFQQAGKHRKRYGVMDGWRLLLFNTKAEADAYRTSLRKDIPAKKLKTLKVAEPAQVIDLPALKESLPSILIPKLDQMIRDRQYTDIDALHRDIAAQRERESADLRAAVTQAQEDRQRTIERARALAEKIQELQDAQMVARVVKTHRQQSMELATRLHKALRLVHVIQRLRSIR